MKKLAEDQGLDLRLFQDSFVSFRKFCIQSTMLPADLYLIFHDIHSGSGFLNQRIFLNRFQKIIY